jgi:aspartate aminotransferase
MDDIYNRLVFDGEAPQLLRLTPPTTSEPPSWWCQRRLQDVRHDRLPHRLGGRQQGPGRGHDQHPVAADLRAGGALAVGGGRGAQRRADPPSRPALTLENNRNVMLERLQAFNGVQGHQAGRHLLLLPRLQRLHEGLAEAGEFLLEKVRVVTVPGKEFGMEGHLRLSYCGTSRRSWRGGAHQVGARPERSPTNSTSATASW